MADEPTNLIFEYLRRIDSRLDGVEKKLDILLDRVSSLEDQFAIMKSDLALMRAVLARVEHRIDQMDKRIERIERRLGLIEREQTRRTHELGMTDFNRITRNPTIQGVHPRMPVSAGMILGHARGWTFR